MREGNWTLKAESACILLGYGSVGKRYRVFDPLIQKFSYSRNVKFDEQENGPSVEEEESVQHPLILTPINNLKIY